jgi:hypothetical protein
MPPVIGGGCDCGDVPVLVVVVVLRAVVEVVEGRDCCLPGDAVANVVAGAVVEEVGGTVVASPSGADGAVGEIPVLLFVPPLATWLEGPLHDAAMGRSRSSPRLLPRRRFRIGPPLPTG